MARKLKQAVGPRGSLRRVWLLLFSLALIAASMAVFSPVAQAVHDTGAFQLDGNAQTSVQSVPSADDDWDRVCREVALATGSGIDCTTPDITTGATAVSWSSDNLLGGGPSLDATIFTGGGSKDPIDINQWAWKDGAGGLPDKANLLHSFAARYSLPSSPTCPSGDAPTCEVLFFGSDRYDNSGDAVQGFWFFQNEITLGTQKLGGGFNFNGVHEDGDLLVISEFSNGGTTSTIVVYEWDSTVSGNLQLLASSTAANCAAVGPNDQFCGIVNAADGTPSPWPFLNKRGNTTFQQGEFFEAGINLSTLGLADRCFASVASETRTSTSTTSVLKDFVLGNFGNCDTTLVTTPQPGTILSIGTGSVSVQDSAMLTVVGIPTWQGTLSFFLCGPIATGTCTTGGTAVGTPIPVTQATSQPISSDSTNVTAAGRYCWRGVFTSGTDGVPNATDASEGECFVVNPVQPTISTQASAAVVVGNPVSDTATLAGTADQPNGNAAGGTITFRLYGPDDATCALAPVFTSAAVPVSGNGTYGSGDFTPTSAGTYRWVAAYTGNSPNTLSVSGACNDANESVVVTPGQPAITTNATAGPVPLGSQISDTATLTGTKPKPNGSPAGGSITFRLYGPSATAVCTGTPVFTSAAIPVSGDGTYGSGNFTPTAAGTYYWVASYSGDAPNTLSVSGNCGDDNEASTVIQLQPAISTAQTFTVKDSATITVAAGAGNLAGSVRFRLYDNASCSGGMLYDSGPVAVSGASPQTVESGTTTITTSQPTLSWLVEYTSTNAGHKNVTSTCNTENASLTINNG